MIFINDIKKKEKERKINWNFISSLPILAYIDDHLEIIIMVHSHQSSFSSLATYHNIPIVLLYGKKDWISLKQTSDFLSQFLLVCSNFKRWKIFLTFCCLLFRFSANSSFVRHYCRFFLFIEEEIRILFHFPIISSIKSSVASHD